jgi:hypothetical protein
MTNDTEMEWLTEILEAIKDESYSDDVARDIQTILK